MAEAGTDRRESALVLAAGLAQGVALVTFPAANAELTSAHGFDLSSGQYGAMFVPQVVLAIVASVVGGLLAARIGLRRVLLIGLGCDLLSMAVLLLAALVGHGAGAYVLLLIATGLLGAGFGLTVPALNALSAALHPHSADRAGLVLNALLGVGTAAAPLLVAVFTAAGAWWLLPVVTGVALLVLVSLTTRVRDRAAPAPDAGAAQADGGRRLLVLFGAAALVYGIVETLSGNWAQTTLTGTARADAAVASVGLAAFWGAVTAGRVLFAALEARLGAGRIGRILPLVVLVAFVGVALLGPGAGVPGVLLFALAGLGCSAVWPLILSTGTERLAPTRAGVTGPLTALYQAGYGVTAFGVGGLLDLKIATGPVFAGGAVAAALLAGLMWAISRRPSSPAPRSASRRPS